jgi:septal ring factor EnvC (AmiA/AmiB activator)
MQLESMTIEFNEFKKLKQENRKLTERLSQLNDSLTKAQNENKQFEANVKRLQGQVAQLKEQKHNELHVGCNRQAVLEKEIRVLKKQNRECSYCAERLKTVVEKERICSDKVIDLEAAEIACASMEKNEERRGFGLELQLINLKTSLKMAEEQSVSGKEEKDACMASLTECVTNSSKLGQILDEVTRAHEVFLSNGFCLTSTGKLEQYSS